MPKGDLRKDIMQPEQIRDMNDTQIQAQIDRYRADLFQNRFDMAKRSLKNHQIMRIKRRNIARLQTVQREREIEALYAAEIAALQDQDNA